MVLKEIEDPDLTLQERERRQETDLARSETRLLAGFGIDDHLQTQ
jgi:hypothetical protein